MVQRTLFHFDPMYSMRAIVHSAFVLNWVPGYACSFLNKSLLFDQFNLCLAFSISLHLCLSSADILTRRPWTSKTIFYLFESRCDCAMLNEPRDCSPYNIANTYLIHLIYITSSMSL
eukprot:342525_1